jgi:hypothetical protein
MYLLGLPSHSQLNPRPLKDRVTDLPPWLEQAAMRLLSRASDERFADAAELVEAFQEWPRITESPSDRTDTRATDPT